MNIPARRAGLPDPRYFDYPQKGRVPVHLRVTTPQFPLEYDVQNLNMIYTGTTPLMTQEEANESEPPTHIWEMDVAHEYDYGSEDTDIYPLQF